MAGSRIASCVAEIEGDCAGVGDMDSTTLGPPEECVFGGSLPLADMSNLCESDEAHDL